MRYNGVSLSPRISHLLVWQGGRHQKVQLLRVYNEHKFLDGDLPAYTYKLQFIEYIVP